MALTQVSSGGIKDAEVKTADIAADAVTGAKIADDAVGSEHIEVLDAALQFGDSVKAQFGTGNDLEIYFDGSNSYIKEPNSVAGQFIVDGYNGIDLRQGATGELMGRFLGGGAATLYHDNSAKIATTSAGVSVTGNLIVGTSGNGIDFSATSDSGGMVNELLDDYEEGTFTPTITKLSGTAVGITYDYQLGNYTKIGNVVRFHLLVSTDAFTANGADTIVIGGLPYTCLSGDAGWCPQHVFCSDTDIPIHTTLVGAATTYLYLYRWNSEAAGTISSIVATDLTTGTNANKNYIRITGSYVG